MYGGTYMGFYKDTRMPNFSKTKWKRVIDNFYNKYIGIAQWHDELIQNAYKYGQYISPTGRILKFKKTKNKYSGVLEYPRGQVLNYPVQSLAADIIHIAMVNAYNQVKEHTQYSKLILQVHDSMVWDVPKQEVDIVCDINQFVFDNLTKYIYDYYNFEFNVPLTGEIKVGKNWGEIE